MAHNGSWLQEAEEAAHREAENERSPCGCDRPPFHTDEEARLRDEIHQLSLDRDGGKHYRSWASGLDNSHGRMSGVDGMCPSIDLYRKFIRVEKREDIFQKHGEFSKPTSVPLLLGGTLNSPAALNNS